jgi:hypothetical protein
MTDFEPEQLLHFGGPKNSLIEQPRVDQSQGSRPLIEEEEAPAISPPSRGPRRIKEGHPYVPRAPLPSPIRKDSFASYFNPANWFKWGKERKLAREAARKINDPSGNTDTSLTAKHWAALNTTHGQRILKKEAKASAKSDATGWNSKIEAFTKNQFQNRQWEQYGHQAVGSRSAWANATDIRPLIDRSLPMPDGVRSDDRYGNVYPQGDGFGPDSARPMKPAELQLAKEEAKDDAQFARAERKEARKAAKKSRATPFESSGNMFDDIQALDPQTDEDGSGSVELIQEKPKAQAPVHESIDDDDDDDLGYKPMAADFMNMYRDMDEENRNKNIAKLMGWK